MEIHISSSPGYHFPDERIYTLKLSYCDGDAPDGIPSCQSFQSKSVDGIYEFLDEKMRLCGFDKNAKKKMRMELDSGFHEIRNRN